MSSINSFLCKIKSRLDKNSSKKRQDCNDLRSEAVKIHVYDMFWFNDYTNAFGVGVYHSGVEIYGTEYCYGGHPFNYSGIFPMAPKDAQELGENYTFKTTVNIGSTDFTDDDIRQLITILGNDFKGEQYHLLKKNCNHFSSVFLEILCGQQLPKWINRLASISSHIPFVEKAIPKEWLTPLNCQDILYKTNYDMSSFDLEKDDHDNSMILEFQNIDDFSKQSINTEKGMTPGTSKSLPYTWIPHHFHKDNVQLINHRNEKTINDAAATHCKDFDRGFDFNNPVNGFPPTE